jgi:8-oxo-dGTP pyrophosphatase MutT (NUDIX family)
VSTGRERPVVRAAGGVVWRTAGDGVEIVLVHRPPPHDDWSLPKGKLEPDERHRDAALREVWEETGLRCELGPRLTETRYETPRGEDKRVRWWAMTVVADEGFTPNREIDGVRWVNTRDLATACTFQADVAIVHLLDTSGAFEGGS